MNSHKSTRRDFLKTMGAGATSLMLPGCINIHQRFAGAKRRKPNLLFIWTDEQRADTMASYGNTRIHAPSLNKLADGSIIFKKAYVTQPVCTPSRSSVMTGLWPHTSGCTANNIPLPPEIPCLPEIINDPDYRTAYMGKWHLGDEIFAQHGFQEWVSIEDRYSDYFTAGRDRSKKSSYHQFLIERGYKPDAGDRFSRQFAVRLPLEHCKPKFLETKACEFLRRHRNEPFILYVNFLEPHMPFFGPFNDKHKPETVDLPINFNDPLEENEPLRYRLLQERFIEKGYEGIDLKTEAGWRRLIANYWGLVSQVDLSVGGILKTLEELGLDDNTLIVYTSDHGDMMGSHRMLLKTVMYEESVKVPWLIRIPQTRRKRIINTAVSQIDMVPTLLELLGHNPDGRFPGQSLVPLINGEKIPANNIFIEWNAGGETLSEIKNSTIASEEQIKRVAGENTRTVISPDGWKLCLSDVDKSQLFNLKDDGGETMNLFDLPQHKDTINQFRERIYQWQENIKDKIRV